MDGLTLHNVTRITIKPARQLSCRENSLRTIEIKYRDGQVFEIDLYSYEDKPSILELGAI
jgi:hypothetical protein